jgi:Arc/MetJ family transcription regulator
VEENMRTNIDLDDTLVKKAMEISGQSTKKAAINTILSEYIRKYNQKKHIKIPWDKNLGRRSRKDERRKINGYYSRFIGLDRFFQFLPIEGIG